jgi:hypothetical protein
MYVKGCGLFKKEVTNPKTIFFFKFVRPLIGVLRKILEIVHYF